MWAALAGAQITRRVGEVLDAVCMFLLAGAFVSGRAWNLVIICLKLRTVEGAVFCREGLLFLLLSLYFLMWTGKTDIGLVSVRDKYY